MVVTGFSHSRKTNVWLLKLGVTRDYPWVKKKTAFYKPLTSG